VKDFLNELEKSFEITSKPLSYFLGMRISISSDSTVEIDQTKYTNKILERVQMENSKPVATPIDANIYSLISADNIVDLPYRELVGALMYLAQGTRYDIAFAVGFLSRYLDKPTKPLWSAGMRVLRFLKGTTDRKLRYSSQNISELLCFSDADFAGEPTTRRSTTGQLIKHGDSIVAWASSRQHSVALSTTEAEYVAASEAVKTAVWLKQLLGELGHQLVPKILIDNQSAIKLIQNPQFHKRTKHIDVRYNFVREKFEEGAITVDFTPSELQQADILTKPLPKPVFQRLLNLSNIQATT
jgi:hypothetical protein